MRTSVLTVSPADEGGAIAPPPAATPPARLPASAAVKASRLARLASRLARSSAKEERALAAAALALHPLAFVPRLLRPSAVLLSLVRGACVARMVSAEGRRSAPPGGSVLGRAELGRADRAPPAATASALGRAEDWLLDGRPWPFEPVPDMSCDTDVAEADSQALNDSSPACISVTREQDERGC